VAAAVVEVELKENQSAVDPPNSILRFMLYKYNIIIIIGVGKKIRKYLSYHGLLQQRESLKDAKTYEIEQYSTLHTKAQVQYNKQ